MGVYEILETDCAAHGYKPPLGEVQQSSPAQYRKLVRYVALQDFVRDFETQLSRRLASRHDRAASAD